jgi:hypothetical protein
MGGLDDYRSSGRGQQKQTHVTFPNPQHPDVSADYADDETMEQHFRAANNVQDSAVDRKLICGDFLAAIDEMQQEDDNEALRTFFHELLE